MSIRSTVSVGVAAAAILVYCAAVPVRAQKPVSMSDVVTETLTVEAIDRESRVVTLKDKNGVTDDIVCGPEVQRFDALKVGDRVTFRFHESVVTALRHAGAPAKPADTTAVTRTPGTAPGGTIARQMTAIVNIQALDPKVPSVSIRTQDGNLMSFKVQNAKNLEGYKVGDRVEVTYTQALAVSVEPAK
jgi:hypothetical protein